MPDVAQSTAMSADDARARLADLIAGKTAWIAKVPTTGNAARILELAIEALAASRETVRAIAWSFGSTVPPPPWPAGPEFVKARSRLEAMRDGAQVFVDKGVTSDVNPRALPALRDAGAELYDRTMKLLKHYIAAPRLPDLLRLVPDPRALVGGASVWLVLLALYLAHREGWI
jgi:hypothetical protein